MQAGSCGQQGSGTDQVSQWGKEAARAALSQTIKTSHGDLADETVSNVAPLDKQGT
jgi:hypothetical protein